MNLKRKNNADDLIKHDQKDETIDTNLVPSLSIEEQIDIFADLIVDQLILQLNENKS